MMSKAKLVALIISIVIAVAILPLMFTLYQKFYVEPTLQRYPPELRPYIDPYPFLATSYALYTYAVWLLLFSLWIVKSIIKTRKTAMVTALILCINFSFLAPVLVHATTRSKPHAGKIQFTLTSMKIRSIAYGVIRYGNVKV